MTTISRNRFARGVIGGFFSILATIVLVVAVAGMDDPSTKARSLAAHGKLDELKKRITKDPDLVNKEVFKDGSTLLHYAAEGGQAETIDYLITQGAKINARDNEGRTALYKAARKGHIEAVKHLIEHEAAVDIRGHILGEYSAGDLPLHAAVNVTRIADVPVPPEEQARRLKMVKLLINAGAKVNARNHREQTPLHIAAESNLPQVVKYLVEHGADIKAHTFYGWTPLHEAAGNNEGSFESLKMLVHLGADPAARVIDDVDEDEVDLGDNALSLAARNGHLKMVKFLLENNVPIQYEPNEFEYEGPFKHSALYDAIRFADPVHSEECEERQEMAGRLAVIDLLAEETGNINAGVKQWSSRATALDITDEPYVIRHLLKKYPEEFSIAEIQAAIEENVEELDEKSRRLKEKHKETLKILREALDKKRGGKSVEPIGGPQE